MVVTKLAPAPFPGRITPVDRCHGLEADRRTVLRLQLAMTCLARHGETPTGSVAHGGLEENAQGSELVWVLLPG